MQTLDDGVAKAEQEGRHQTYGSVVTSTIYALNQKKSFILRKFLIHYTLRTPNSSEKKNPWIR